MSNSLNPQRNREAAMKHYYAKREFVWAWKSSGCVMCGETDPIVLDADHIDESNKNQKLKACYTKGAWPLTALNWEDLKLELTKCQVLCANCHRRKTFERKYLGEI